MKETKDIRFDQTGLLHPPIATRKSNVYSNNRYLWVEFFDDYPSPIDKGYIHDVSSGKKMFYALFEDRTCPESRIILTNEIMANVDDQGKIWNVHRHSTNVEVIYKREATGVN